MIPLSVPNISGNEIKYITEALESEWVSTAGPFVSRLEEVIADYIGVQETAVVQSGTAGLHLALHATGVCRGDEVIVPTLTFIASVNPVAYLGAHPVFMDSDSSYCMDLDKLESFLVHETYRIDDKTFNKKTNRQIKALIIVHIFGNAVDMNRLLSLSKAYNFILIEDATEALGSKYKSGSFKGKYLGTIGDYGIFSFNGNKIVTTGGGGAVCSNVSGKVSYIRYLSNQAKDDVVFYKHNEVGYNYRMTNLQAAVGLAQMERIDVFIKRKKEIHQYYLEQLNGVFEVVSYNSELEPNYWLNTLYSEEIDKSTRDKTIKQFALNNVQVRPIWDLIHCQKPYNKDYAYEIEQSYKLCHKSINIPSSSNLSDVDVKTVVSVLNQIEGKL